MKMHLAAMNAKWSGDAADRRLKRDGIEPAAIGEGGMRWTSWARVALVLIAFAAGYIIRFKFDYSWWIAVGVAVAIVAILMPLVGALSDFDEDF